jgi:hypothetical protein
MADQIIVSNNTVQVAVQPTPTVQVEISRAAIGTVSNVPTANYANFAGNVVNAAQPNITSVGTLTNLNVANTITTNNLVVTGNFQVGNLVANTANYANFAGEAFDVALANVSGAGNIASINLDGSASNVLYGNGIFAPGGSGNTANANYANFAGNAFSVDGGNVVGAVANATFALDAGTANIANIAYSVDGANVNGEVAVANTVSNPNQSNITTVGTLTGLTVSGNISANVITANTLIGNLALTGVDYIDFDTAANASAAVGRLKWNNSDGTLEFGLKGGNVNLQIGQEEVYEVRNATGNVIQNGTALYASGVTPSGRIEASPYVANNTIDSIRFLGIATEQVNDGVNGFVTNFGYVRDLDTRGTANTAISVGDENWSVGDILWAHPTAPGKLTNVQPSAPNNKISVAYVIIRNQTSGVLFVRPTREPKLVEIQDVGNGNVQNGDVLVYNSTTTVWTPSNTVPVANIAYSVDGANVSGTVANATFALDAGNANIAYSVDAANVSGLGNIATINLDGNASNFLDGTGNFVAAPSGANANYANFAGDVVNSTQSNITTVGTLTNANVSNTGNIRLGNIIINEASNITANVLNQVTVASNVVSNAYRALSVSSGSISDLTGISDATVIAGALNLTSGAIGNATNRITTTTANIAGAGISILGGNSWGGNNTGRNVTTQPVNLQSGGSRSLTAATATAGSVNITGGPLVFGTATTVNGGSVNINPTTIATESTAANISATTVNIPAASLGFGRFNIVTSNTAITNVTTPLVNFGGAFGIAMAYANGVSNVVVDTFRPLDQVFFRTGGVGHLSGGTGGNVSNISVGNITTAGLIFDTGSWLYPNGANVSNVSAGNVTTGDVNIRTGIASNTASVTGTYNRGNIKLNAKNVILEAGITSVTSGTGTFIFDANNTANLGNLVVSNYFSGNGSLLTGITATDANYANFAGNAYSVDGANVIGAVANATFADDAALANIANIAYYIDGANVSGAVANAIFADDSTYASIAYSVDVANVSGIGNIATINLDGSASNVLYGNGTFATAPAGGGETLSPFLLMGG